ncbi:MAG: LysR family transcriptional regulator [Hyphomicrobiales bacterium]|nr:MAG: LysR family transcriptional regulator [Hyphomicrobiales bacterium]
MSFDWNDLRYFLSVARTGRLTAAARRMGTDHATVSRRVTSLEQKLGATLFTRSPRGYSLTDTGERLLMHAEAMESSAAHAQNEIAGEKFSLSGSVRIGAPDAFGAFFLAPRLAELSARHPQLELQIVTMPRIFSLSKREADIAIGLARPDKGRLFSKKLIDYRLHLYAAPGYLADAGPIDSPEDFRKHHFIGYIPDLIAMPELDYLNKVAEISAPHLSSSNLFAQMYAAEAGGGLCILPDFLVDGRSGLVPVLPERVELTRSFWIMAHLDSRDSTRIQTVIAFISEQVKQSKHLFAS